MQLGALGRSWRVSRTGSLWAGGGRKIPGRLIVGILRFAAVVEGIGVRGRRLGGGRARLDEGAAPGTSCPAGAGTESVDATLHQPCRTGCARTSPGGATRSPTSSSSSSGARAFQRGGRGAALDPVRRDGHATARSRRSPATRTPSAPSGSVCAREPLRARRALPPRGRRGRARLVRLARRRLQAPAAGARRCRSLTTSAPSSPRSRPRASATGSRSSRRSSTSPGRLHLLGRGEVVAPSRPRELRGRAARVHAAALLRRRLRDPHLPAASLRAGDALPAPRRRRRRRARAAERGGVVDARLAPRERPPQRIVGRALLPRRLPARGAARGRVGERAAVAPPRGAEREPGGRRGGRRGRGGRRRGAPRRGARRAALAYAKGIDRIAGRPRRGRGQRRGARSEERAVVGSTKARAPTGSRTPTTRTSSAPAARPTRSSRPSAGSSARAGWTSFRRAYGRSPSCACGIRRCPSRELARKCDPPASKAAAHRRLRTLLRIAQR